MGLQRLAMGQAGGFHVFNLPRSPLKVGSDNRTPLRDSRAS
jgi:hypothetical protein